MVKRHSGESQRNKCGEDQRTTKTNLIGAKDKRDSAKKRSLIMVIEFRNLRNKSAFVNVQMDDPLLWPHGCCNGIVSHVRIC